MKRFFSTATNKYANLPKFQTQLLINGKFQNSQSGKTFDVLNPATEEVLVKVQEGAEADVNLAVKSSREAFDKGPWSKMNGAERSRLLYKLSDLLEKMQTSLLIWNP